MTRTTAEIYARRYKRTTEQLRLEVAEASVQAAFWEALEPWRSDKAERKREQREAYRRGQG